MLVRFYIISVSLLSHIDPTSAVQLGKILQSSSDSDHNYVLPSGNNIDCSAWAAEGKCHQDMRFMWTQCPFECARMAHVGAHPSCAQWAGEGECANNPRYMLARCAEACSYAVLWDPWVRARDLGIAPAHNVDTTNLLEHLRPSIPSGLDDDEHTDRALGSRGVLCLTNRSIIHAAFKMHSRVRRFIISVGPSPIEGFTVSSPSHLNMMVGVVEAMAYTMRIYGHLLLSSRDITSEAREHYHRNLNAMLDTTILRRWDADLLMRKLPYYLHLLDEMLGMLYDSVGIESSDSSQTDAVPIDLCALFAERIGSNEAPIAPGAGTHTLSGTHSGNDNKQSESTAAYIDLPGLMDSLLPSSVAVDASGGSASVPDVGSVDTSMTLNNGATFPAIGLGTWQLDGQKCTDAVLAALQIGYRHIDSAEAYRNERAVGDAITQALRTGLVKDRDELFIATKLSSPNSAGGYGKTRNTVMRQLADLQVDYIDLYMLHSPLEHVLQDETWSELEQLYNEGLIRALGVSNFDVRELNHLLSKAKVPPAVVQNKFDIYHQGKQFDATGMNMLRFCKERGIVLVAYSSFSAYPFVMQPLDDPIVLEIASRLRMTPSELLMFYNTQLGVASIPRSTDVDHLKENFLHKYRSSDTSDHRLSIRLSDGDMRRLSGIQHLVTTPVTLVGL